jgi:hypothetical protein
MCFLLVFFPCRLSSWCTGRSQTRSCFHLPQTATSNGRTTWTRLSGRWLPTFSRLGRRANFRDTPSVSRVTWDCWIPWRHGLWIETRKTSRLAYHPFLDELESGLEPLFFFIFILSSAVHILVELKACKFSTFFQRGHFFLPVTLRK